MKALDKVFDTSNYRHCSTINFISREAKRKISYMKKERKRTRERRYQALALQKKINLRIYQKVKVNGTLNDVSVTNYMIQ